MLAHHVPSQDIATYQRIIYPLLTSCRTTCYIVNTRISLVRYLNMSCCLAVFEPTGSFVLGSLTLCRKLMRT
jgi:hypothetical protein